MAASKSQRASEPYQVIARRFRPQSFQDVVGQDEVLQSLRLALQQKRVPHAFIFAGSRGVGKTTSARILARCLNCVKGPTPDPCGTCELCTSIQDGSNLDVIEIDAASNRGIDDVRRLREQTSLATMRSRYRVFILDEFHMLTKEAFNALLKTLEEPPPRVVFALATTELHKVPETIRSRCQVLLFRRVGETDIEKRLRMIAEREGVQIAGEVLAEIAASVRGGVRDAETALERVLPLAREHGDAFDLAAFRAMTARVGLDGAVDVIASLLQGDARQALHFARTLQQNGTDEREALGELVETLRWLLLLKVDGADSGLVPASGRLRERLQQLAESAELHRLDAMIAAGVRGRERLRVLEDRGVVLEVALVRMAQAGVLPTVADLLAEVRAGGVVMAAPAPAAAAATAHATPPADGADLRARTIAQLQNRPLLQATVEQCRFDAPPQGAVVVTLHSERKMHQDRLQSPVVQQELLQAIRAAAGSAVAVEFRVAGSEMGVPPTAGGAAAPPAARVEPGPPTKRVMDRFHGRIVQVNPEERRRETRPAADEGTQRDGSGADPRDGSVD